VTAQLSAPAPAGGVTLNLWLDEPLAMVPASVFIPAGQTLSAPIAVTGVRRWGRPCFTPAARSYRDTTIINVIDTPDVNLRRFAGSSTTGSRLWWGWVCRSSVCDFGGIAAVPVDVVVSAPPGSGVLFSLSSTAAGSESLLVKTGLPVTRHRTFLTGHNPGRRYR